MKSIEQMTQEYWIISIALRGSADPYGVVTTEYAMRTLGRNTDCLSEDRTLAVVSHELKFDIIEGDTKWRGGSNKPEPGTVSRLIQSTKR